MPLFMYLCPKTGYRVQGFSPEDISEDHHIYEPVTCPACRQVHHVNPRTGAILERKANRPSQVGGVVFLVLAPFETDWPDLNCSVADFDKRELLQNVRLPILGAGLKVARSNPQARTILDARALA